RASAQGPVARELQGALANYDIKAARVEPLGLRTLTDGALWRRVALSRPDTRLAEVRLPAAVVDAPARIAFATVNPDRGAPIALDVLTRYTHPRLRLLLRAAPDREALAAEVNLACRLDLLMVVGVLGAVPVAAITRDRIAAELIGLALREDPVLSSRELAGLWEDKLVQRATELDLGVAVPSQLRLHLPSTLPADAGAALDRILLRLGLPPRAAEAGLERVRGEG
ncbi:MAG: hypothetical protein M3N47_14220, partial [Chloroflexota bacterium]|nr:hypothetical protein [Chloroflexota bacterium]